MDLQELEAIAESELLKHGLYDWSFRWATTKRRQGACNYRWRRIEIAEYYATHNPPEKVLDTLLHEIDMPLLARKLATAPSGKLWQRNSEPRLVLVTHATKLSSCPATGRQPVMPARRRTINTNVR